MKLSFPVLALLLLACVTAQAGVVITMEAREAGSSGEPGTDTFYAQGEMLRIDPHPEKEAGNTSIVFRDDTLWIIDHDRKVCQKMDKAGMEALSNEIGGVMKQMEAELAKMPPEQRAMVEKMMKSKMPQGMGGMAKEAPPRRVDVGGTETIGKYDCTLHTVYSGDTVVSEMCTAGEGAVAAAQEAMPAFEAMARFSQELVEVLRQGPLAEMIDTPFMDMSEMRGIPVRIRTYADGRITSESTLQSVERQDLEAELFSVPKNYKVEDMADQIKKGR